MDLSRGMPVSDRIYISDVDVQSASDFETLRIDRRLVDDLSSVLPGKRKSLIDRISENARKNPMAIMAVLLRYYDHGDQRVSGQVRQIMNNLLREPSVAGALRESLFSVHREISQAAAKVLDEQGFEGAKLKGIFDSIQKYYAESNLMDIHTEDIVELVNDGIRIYREGSLQQAFENLIMARDLIRDRVDWNENIRRYIKDVLRMTPELSQGGVQIDSIQESLKVLSDAVKKRDYRETRELIEAKKTEAAIVRELSSTFSFISKRLKVEELPDKYKMPKKYSELFDSIKKVNEEIGKALKEENRLAALRSFHTFIAHDFTGNFLKEISSDLDAGNKETIAVARDALTGIAMILENVMPNTASDLYETYLREDSGKDSIKEMDLPQPLEGIKKKKAAKKKKSTEKKTARKPSKKKPKKKKK